MDLPRWEEIPEFARLLVIRRLAVLLARRAASSPGPAAGGERDESAGLGSSAGQGHGGAL